MTLQELEWIEQRVNSRLSNRDLVEEFQRTFNKSISRETIRQVKLKHGVHKERKEESTTIQREESPRELSDDEHAKLLDQRLKFPCHISESEYLWYAEYKRKHGLAVYP